MVYDPTRGRGGFALCELTRTQWSLTATYYDSSWIGTTPLEYVRATCLTLTPNTHT